MYNIKVRRWLDLARDQAWWLYKPLGQAISDYSMIQAGDTVLLGISGGKDSLLMAICLINEEALASEVQPCGDHDKPWGPVRLHR